MSEGQLEQLAHELAIAPLMELSLRPETAFALAGLVQLALKHPEVSHFGQVAPYGRAYLEVCRLHFQECQTVLRVLEMGDRSGNNAPGA